jgi:hypothetical protein
VADKKPRKDYEVVDAVDPRTGETRPMTNEDRSGQGPRERRIEDRRKADEKTSNVKRKLSDRRTTYNLENNALEHSNRIGEKFRELLNPLDRMDREAIRRGQPLGYQIEEGRGALDFRPLIKKIKGRKSGLLGLGLAVLSAGVAAKEAYAETEEKKK